MGKEYTRETAPVLYHLLNSFVMDEKKGKDFLKFLFRHKAYSSYVGRISQYRLTGIDSISLLKDIKYPPNRRTGWLFVMMNSFVWYPNPIYPHGILVYYNHFNNMLPENTTWEYIDEAWEAHVSREEE